MAMGLRVGRESGDSEPVAGDRFRRLGRRRLIMVGVGHVPGGVECRCALGRDAKQGK